MFEFGENPDRFLTEDEFRLLIIEARTHVGTIMRAGGMATKSAVENLLMAAHPGLTRRHGHDVMNHIEYHNLKPIYPS